MQKSDEAIARLLPRIDKLIELGFRPEWVSEEMRPYARAAASLFLRGHSVTPIAVELIGGSNSNWEQIKPVFGKGGIEPQEAVNSAMAFYMRSQAEPIQSEINKMLRSDPDGIVTWLPEEVRKLTSLVQRGSVYDPRPSSHFRQPIPQVVRTFNNFLDDLMRGGVYSGAMLIVVAAPSGGKSTTAYTLAANCAKVGSKCVLITGEELESAVVMRSLMAMTGHSREKVIAFQSVYMGKPMSAQITEHEYDNIKAALDRLDIHLTVYDKSSMDIGRIDDIVAWEKPEVLIIDHIMMVEDKATKKTGSTAFDIGALFYGIQHITLQKYRIHTVIMSQTSGAVAEKLKNGHMPKHVFPFGSSMGDQAAGALAVISKHPGLQGRSRWYYTKDKLLNHDTDRFAIRHDATSQSFTDMQRDSWSS